MCHIIDAVAFKDDATEFQEAWDSWKLQFEEFYARESDYALSEEDASIVGNIPPLLSALSTSVGRAFQGTQNAEDLCEDVVSFFHNHDKFVEERQRSYFVENPSLDRLLKASVSHIQGRAEQTAIQNRAADAAQAVGAIHELYLDTRDMLPKEMVNGCVKGFELAQEGFNTLASADEDLSEDALRDAIFQLKSAGELLAHLPNFCNKIGESSELQIPILGPFLSAIRNQEEVNEEQLESLREDILPQFVNLWESRQDGWMLKPEVALRVLDETHETVVNMVELLEIYPEQEEEFWATVDDLEEMFKEIRENAMEVDSLQSSPFWPEIELLVNLLRGGSPLYAANVLLSGISNNEVPEPIAIVGQALQAYLEEQHPLPLLEALSVLAEDYELSKTTRPCANCGMRMPLEAKTCPECGTKVEEFSMSG